MELLFWFFPTCATLWFLDGLGIGFLLNSANGNHQIFTSDNLFGFSTLTQHSNGNKPNIPAIVSLSIHSNLSDIVLSATTAPSLDPTHSTEINPFYRNSGSYAPSHQLSPTQAPCHFRWSWDPMGSSYAYPTVQAQAVSASLLGTSSTYPTTRFDRFS